MSVDYLILCHVSIFFNLNQESDDQLLILRTSSQKLGSFPPILSVYFITQNVGTLYCPHLVGVLRQGFRKV